MTTNLRPGTSQYYEDKARLHQRIGQISLAIQCRREASKLRQQGR